jgi:uncharacterized membrane protein YraQ (UPF0718 family)
LVVTFSFLITSPLVNEVAIGLFIGLFGVRTTILYVVSGILLGTISGVILHKLKLERHLTPWVKDLLAKGQKDQKVVDTNPQSLKQRLPSIWNDTYGILKGVISYVLVGIAIGGLMHGYIPEVFLLDTWQRIICLPSLSLLY